MRRSLGYGVTSIPTRHKHRNLARSTKDNTLEREIVAYKPLQRSFYVYSHAYPEGYIENDVDLSDVVFYVGKGTIKEHGIARIDAHEEEARKGYQSEKCDIIRRIWSKGFQVKKTILYRTDNEIEAFEKEGAMLSFYASDLLTNVYGADNKYRREIVASSSLLTELRLEALLSRKELAEIAGVSESSILRIERGSALKTSIVSNVVEALGKKLGRVLRIEDIPGLRTSNPCRIGPRKIGDTSKENTLQNLRIQANLTREQLAYSAGVSPTTLARIESGNQRTRENTAINVLNALSKEIGYEVTISSLEGLKLYNDMRDRKQRTTGRSTPHDE